MGCHPGPADFARPRQAPGGGDLPAAEWTLIPVPAPAAGPAPQARAWVMSRCRHYRAGPPLRWDNEAFEVGLRVECV